MFMCGKYYFMKGQNIIMKRVKILIVAVVILLLVPMKQVYASEQVYTLQNIPPELCEENERVVYGRKPPKSSADTHDLSISAYAYQVEDVGAAVYTSKWLTGASSIHVFVENWTLLKSSIGATDDQVTVTVYDTDKKRVNSVTITIDERFLQGSGDITGLDSSKKYYVRFSVPQNENRYSFNGDISAN